MVLYFLGRQILVSPETRESDLGVSISMTTAVHGDKESKSWDQLSRPTEAWRVGGQGNKSEEEEGEGCRWVRMLARAMELGLGVCSSLLLPPLHALTHHC
jgi:hypothetical protein